MMNHQHSKLLNKYDILKLVTIQRPISRLQLQQITGLSKMTISNLVREYIAEGVILSEKKTIGNGVGRKTELLNIDPESLLTLGVYIDNEVMKAGMIDLKGSILIEAEYELSAEESGDLFLKKLFKLCDSVMNFEHRGRVWGIGVSSKGPLDIFQGSILLGKHFPQMPSVEVVEPLAQRYQIPAYIDNDANVSALAELYFSNGHLFQNFIYVVVKEGIGAGIIINQRPYPGSNGFSGELGHVIICHDGKKCHCGGRGCLEQYAGLPAILEAYRERTGVKLTWADFENRAAHDEPAALALLDEMANWLATGLLSTVNLMDPQCIYFGGKIGFSLDRIISTVQARLDERFAPIGKIEVRSSKFPYTSSFIGTAALVMERNCTIGI